MQQQGPRLQVLLRGTTLMGRGSVAMQGAAHPPGTVILQSCSNSHRKLPAFTHQPHIPCPLTLITLMTHTHCPILLYMNVTALLQNRC